MMRVLTQPLALLLLVAVAAACTGRPIPMSVVPGSTMVLPFFGDQINPLKYEFGYTSEVTGEFDRQRGEMIFMLCPLGQVTCSPGDPNSYQLFTRYVTSVYPHPASMAGIDSQYTLVTGSDAPLSTQQFAVVDVPTDVPPNASYQLAVMFRETEGGPVTDPWQDATSTHPAYGTIEVLPGTGTPTPFNRSRNNGLTVGGAEVELAQFVPQPRALVKFGYLTLRAATISLTYPEDQIEILSVFEDDSLGQGSMLRRQHANLCYQEFRGEDQAEATCQDLACGDCLLLSPPSFAQFCWDDCVPDYSGPDELTVHFISPDRHLEYLSIVFRLRDPNASTVSTSDFVVQDYSLFDTSGDTFSATPPPSVTQIR